MSSGVCLLFKTIQECWERLYRVPTQGRRITTFTLWSMFVDFVKRRTIRWVGGWADMIVIMLLSTSHKQVASGKAVTQLGWCNNVALC